MQRAVSDIEWEMIEGCKAGKSKAQEKLYRHFYGYAMSISLQYAGDKNEASEILNDSFLKVFKKIDSYESSKPFKSWMRRIIINTAIDYYRVSKKFSRHVEVEQADYNEADDDIVDKLNAEDILKLLQQLPEQYRISFNLYEIEGYSHEEIAEMLGIPVGTSRSNLTRAKKKLRELVMKIFQEKYERTV